MLTFFQELGDKGASAMDWAAAVSSVVGGKAGGKEPTVLGNGTEPQKVDEALEAAAKYLEKFTL